jgi:hypothetical protein
LKSAQENDVRADRKALACELAEKLRVWELPRAETLAEIDPNPQGPTRQC